jgi:Flp pilus assembly protein TadG
MMALRRLLRDGRAAASAEFALILPGFALIFLNVADLGHYIFTKMQVDLAAHEAVGAARVLCNEASKLPATEGSKCPGHSAAMTSAAQSTSLGNSVSLGTINEAWYCANASGDLVQVAAVGGTVPANCSGTVSGSTAEPGDYISVTASKSFSPIFPGASVASLMPATITREAWMRLQ